MSKPKTTRTPGRKAAKPSSIEKASTQKSRPKKAATTKRTAQTVAGTLRLPKVGEKLTRTYRDKEIVVEVLKDGFRYDGETYTSLTALAKKITGYKAISGPAFFGLWKRAEAK